MILKHKFAFRLTEIGKTDGQTYGTDRDNTECPSAILRIGGGIKNARVDFLVHDTSY